MRGGGVDAVSQAEHHLTYPNERDWFSSERPVFYSLSNFVFAGHAERTWTNYGMLARLTLKPDRTLEAEACPYVIEGHVPKPLEPSAAANQRFRQHLRTMSLNVGGSEITEPAADGCYRLAPLQCGPLRLPILLELIQNLGRSLFGDAEPLGELVDERVLLVGDAVVGERHGRREREGALGLVRVLRDLLGDLAQALFSPVRGQALLVVFQHHFVIVPL